MIPRAALLVGILLPTWLTAALNEPPPPTVRSAPAIGPTPDPGPEIPADLPRISAGPWLGTLIDVDGRTHPELIPQHSVWTWLLDSLVSERGNPPLWKYRQGQLRLSPKDLATLEATLKRHAEHRNEINKKLSDRAAVLQAKGENFLDEMSFQMVLESRQAVLDEADRLMEQLSPESQLALEIYKDDYVRHVSVSIPEKAWNLYKLPR